MPDFIDSDPKTFAANVFDDVSGRIMTLHVLTHNPEFLIKLGVSQLDFGEKVRAKAEDAQTALGQATGDS